MSHWTSILASIYINTNIFDKNIRTKIEHYLNNAPKITGSEGNAEVFISIPYGYTTTITVDCEHCPYGDTVETCTNNITCDAPDTFKCPANDYQTQVVITIMGNLRDRFKEETQREYKEFLKYVRNIEHVAIASVCKIK